MSDTGGPEDPEVEKLREQLEAAERVAELRIEVESARAELDRIENDLTTARKEFASTP